MRLLWMISTSPFLSCSNLLFFMDAESHPLTYGCLLAVPILAKEERLPCLHCGSLRRSPLFSQLLLNLEEAVHSLQSTDEKTERKPWRKDGHEFIGKPTRRFFEASDCANTPRVLVLAGCNIRSAAHRFSHRHW